MRLATTSRSRIRILLLALAVTLVPAIASAAAVLQEHVTGGSLDLGWLNGFGVSNNLQPLTLSPADPAYANPSGDHTVGLALTSSTPDSGGIILTCTNPGALSDYSWEGWVFTGDGNSRRGLVVRADAATLADADPANDFSTCYQFVFQSGLLQFNFRRLVNSAPTTLGTWFSNAFPGGSPAVNTWHKMKVTAIGNTFRCYWDGFELTNGSPILDSSIPTGWVGVYNFRFDLGNIPFYVDDLILDDLGATPTARTTWGALKSRYVK
jgi:hypothetical protein